ncbi:MAG TPA: ABC transporter substrate-binding protein [Gammaproteobacteria bacterium]|nr:ABC transporter substrate-binding protein [Gammaproteobacteria bacterium]
MKKFFILLVTTMLFTSFKADATEKLTVLLDWFANPDHAPLLVAKEKGFFEEAGLDVKLIGPADPADPPKLVAAQKADIAITYEPDFIEQVDQGLPLVQLATLIDKPLACLTVLQESPLHSIRDLKGKEIGYSTGSVTDIVLKTMLEKNGIHADDFHAINLHYDLTEALLSKKIDAVSGMIRTYEIIQMDLAGHPARIFLPEQNGVPTYSELIFVVNKNNRHDPRFQPFMTALKKGMDYCQKHPEESWQLIIKSHPELNDTLNRRAFFATLPYFAKKPDKINSAEWRTFIAFMQKKGVIKTIHPLSDYVI